MKVFIEDKGFLEVAKFLTESEGCLVALTSHGQRMIAVYDGEANVFEALHGILSAELVYLVHESMQKEESEKNTFQKLWEVAEEG